MSIPEAIDALAAQWDSAALHLTDEQLTEISIAARATPPQSAAHRTADVLAAGLPRHHPVHRALVGGRRLARGTSWEQVGDTLARIADSADALLAERSADTLLERAPMTPWETVRGRGLGSFESDLIRLNPERTPAFQFDRGGRPIPVVIEINRLLDARSDPWGVADWWLGDNAWLAGVPADLLGEVDDQVLVAAARADLEVD